MPGITYRSGGADLDAHLAVPDRAVHGDGPWPGVVVIHDVTGFRGDVVAQAERMAEHGYVTLAPALYSRGAAPVCLVRTMKAAVSGSGPAFADIEAARVALADRADCTGRVGLVGFCLGGDFAIQCAPRYDFAAVSVNYGRPPKDLTGACPVVGSYGKHDRFLAGAAARLEKELTRAGVPHDVREYETVGHSFLNDIPAAMRHPANPMNLLMNLKLRDPDAAADAWRRIHAFFAEHLRDPDPGAARDPDPGAARDPGAPDTARDPGAPDTARDPGAPDTARDPGSTDG